MHKCTSNCPNLVLEIQISIAWLVYSNSFIKLKIIIKIIIKKEAYKKYNEERKSRGCDQASRYSVDYS